MNLFYVLCGMLMGFCFFRIFTPSKTEIKEELEIEHNAELNKAYMQGYALGKSAGRQEAIFNKYSKNEIRAALELPPIESGAE